jgi:hypothetical protein
LQVAVTAPEDAAGSSRAATVLPDAAGALAASVPQVSTPLWPRQAPDREVPENAAPSLQVAVTLAGVCAHALPARKSPIPNETERSADRMNIPRFTVGDDGDPASET